MNDQAPSGCPHGRSEGAFRRARGTCGRVGCAMDDDHPQNADAYSVVAAAGAYRERMRILADEPDDPDDD
jgi:hypothetical protein